MKDLEFKKNSDRSIKPVFEDSFLLIQRSLETAVPGMYTIEPQLHRESIRELTDTELALIAYSQRLLRHHLKSAFGVEICGLYLEEQAGKRIKSYTIPFYVDRLSEQFSLDEYQLYAQEYFRSYTYDEFGQQIESTDAGIRDILKSPGVKRDIGRIIEGASSSPDPETIELETKHQVPEIDATIEVYDESELPVAPKGKKYFVCIGGNKNFQCFLSDETMSKGEFLISHEDEVDNCLRPVYEDDKIIVRQDSRYAIPGFYIVSPRRHYRRIDEIPQDTYQRCLFTARDISQTLSTMGVQRTHLYHDEKYRARMSAHFWVMPLYDGFAREHNFNLTILSRDIWTYLDSFPRFSITRSQIQEFNQGLRKALERGRS